MYLSKYSAHPASTSSGPERMLCGSPGTVNATFAGGGSLFINSSLVLVVLIGMLDGVSSNLFFRCILASLLGAPSIIHVTDAAVSKKLVRCLLFGGGAQPKTLSSSISVALYATASSAALPPHLRRFTKAFSMAAAFLFLFSGFCGQY